MTNISLFITIKFLLFLLSLYFIFTMLEKYVIIIYYYLFITIIIINKIIIINRNIMALMCYCPSDDPRSGGAGPDRLLRDLPQAPYRGSGGGGGPLLLGR